MQTGNYTKMRTESGINAVFMHATEGILVVNEHGEITEVNPSAEKLFGYEHGELHGKKIEALVPKRLAGDHKKNRNNYTGNPHARAMGAEMELSALRKDGTEFPVEISLSPYTVEDKKFVVAFVVDITLRKNAEEKLKNYSVELEQQVRDRTLILEEAIDELKQTKKELDQALWKEKELNELKSRFVSMASHEFRTPLTTMMSSLSLVSKYEQKGDSENHSRHVEKMKSSINLLTDILNDFLSVSKLEEGKIKYVPEELNLREFIGEIVAELQAMTINGQSLQYAHSGPEITFADKKLLKHILFNLISNAIKFSPEGQPVMIKSIVSQRELKLSVSDHGIGISKADQEHLFERFFRGQNAAHIQGTGLGLNIVSKYVELMNGKITFTSAENQGTTFTITQRF